MFQRQQSRTSFSIIYIILAAVAVIGITLFILKKDNSNTSETSETEKKSDSLRPDEWLDIAREYPNFEPSLKMKFAALTEAASMANQRGGGGFDAPWTVEGPYNIGARINTVKIHPTNPNIIYAGFAHGGVWKTTDGGQNWKPIFDKQTAQAIGDIELDPKNPEIVYVGTGDLNIGGYVFIGNGLYRSNDGGQTWQNIGLENQRIISKIIVHPTNSNIIYAATMGLPFQRNNERGLYKTTNGGQTWQQILFVSSQAGIIDLEMSPDNPNELFATSWDRIRTSKESTYYGENAKIWKTTNGGTNWQPLTNGLPTGKQGRIGLSQCTSQPNILYAVQVDTSSNLSAIYRSNDRGATWNPTAANPGDGGDPLGGFGWYFGHIEVNPNNPNDVFILGVDLWRTDDGGQSWFRASPDWWTYDVHADKHDLVFYGNGKILLATDGGLYRSTDNAENWEDIENIPTTQIYRVAINPHNPDFYYGGAQDNGTFGGNSTISQWDRIYGGDGFQAVFHPTDPNILYFETQNGNIVGTADGSFFDSGTSGIDDNDRRHWDMQYIISPHDPEVMYVGTQRIYASFGHLPNWYPVSDDLTDGLVFEPRFHTITTLDESPVEQNLLYVGTVDGNVWRGNPTTMAWQNITPGLPERYVSSVKASPNFANRVYVTHTGYRDNDFTPHLHRSDDRGATWKSVAGNLPNLAIYDVYILPGHQDSIIFTATDGGVFATLNGGKNWSRVGSNMPVVPVFDLTINPATNRLVAGTFARSIMTFPLDSVLNASVPTFSPTDFAKIELAVLPNLMTDRANILVKNLPASQPCEVFVADFSGKILVQKNFRRGEQPSFVFENQGLAAGVYFAFAKIGGKMTAAEKFVVGR